jgi:hypothetical protein
MEYETKEYVSSIGVGSPGEAMEGTVLIKNEQYYNMQ